MSGGEVTRVLDAAARGDADAAAQLLPLVYEELRKLAAQRIAHETPGQTLQATALVHEAYLRLVGTGGAEAQHWNGRGHFFAAAAEAMRRILIDRARRVRRERHGGRERVDLHQLDPDQLQSNPADGAAADDLLALDEALTRLEAEEPAAAEVVKLRYFTGMTIEEAAAALRLSVRTANRHWAYAKAWLHQLLGGRDGR